MRLRAALLTKECNFLQLFSQNRFDFRSYKNKTYKKDVFYFKENLKYYLLEKEKKLYNLGVFQQYAFSCSF